METDTNQAAVPGGIWVTARDHVVYLAIIALYCVPYVRDRDLFYRDESRFAGIVRDMILNNAWFTLRIGDDYYLEKPPLFFSLARLAAEISGTLAPPMFFILIGLTAFFFVAASDAFLRMAGFDRRIVRTANLLMLAVPWIVVHMQTMRMDLLFSGLILFSAASYVSGIERSEANFRPLIGGLLAGVAVLVKGPFGALIPLFALATYLAATGRIRLLMRADLLWSLALLLLPNILWLANIYATFGTRVIEDLFRDQIVERALSGRHSNRPWWLYPLALFWTAMPLLALAPALLVGRIRRAVISPSALPEPRPSTPGWQFVIAYFCAAIVILMVVAQRHLHFLLPAIPAFMIFVAVFYRQLDAAVPRLVDWFYISLAVVALIAPPVSIWAFGYASARFQADLTNYVSLETLNLTAATLSLTAIPLAIAARLRGEARLYSGIAAAAIMVIAVKAIVVPDLDRVFSPRHAAAQFETLVPADQQILVYNVYWGSLSYHFDHPLVYVYSAEELQDRMKKLTGPAYVIARTDHWRREADLWQGFAPIAESRLETTELVLLERPQID